MSSHQDVLSFLESLDELTSTSQKTSTNVSPKKPATNNTPNDVLAFLDEITTTVSKDKAPAKESIKPQATQSPPLPQPSKPQEQTNPLPNSNVLMVQNVPPPTGQTPPPPQPVTAPPSTGFVKSNRGAKRVAPPELSGTGQTLQPTQHVQNLPPAAGVTSVGQVAPPQQTSQGGLDFPILMNTATGSTLVKPGAFKVDAAFKPETSSPLVTGNVITTTAESNQPYKSWWSEQEPGTIQPREPSVEQARHSDDAFQPQSQGSQGWSWGSILNTGTKLLETAKEQVAQVNTSQVSERLKKININTDKFKEIGGIVGSEFKAITNTVIDSIAPPVASSSRPEHNLPRPSMFVHFPNVDEHITGHVVDLTKFCCSEIFGSNAGWDGREARDTLGGDPVVTSASEWGNASGTIVQGVENASKAADQTLQNLMASYTQVQKTLNSTNPISPPLYLIIQPFTLTLTTEHHTAYLVLLHRPALSALKTSIYGTNQVNLDPAMDIFEEVLHFVTVSQTVPSPASVFGKTLTVHQPPSWFNEQKLRVLESAVYGCFDSIVVWTKQRRVERGGRSSVSSGRPSMESGTGFSIPQPQAVMHHDTAAAYIPASSGGGYH